jgi:hypothetical protein
MKDGRTFGLGYTPSKFLRQKMIEKVGLGQAEKQEIVSASQWTPISGQIIGISYDSNGHLQKFNFRMITQQSHMKALSKKCRKNNKRTCPKEL